MKPNFVQWGALLCFYNVDKRSKLNYWKKKCFIFFDQANSPLRESGSQSSPFSHQTHSSPSPTTTATVSTEKRKADHDDTEASHSKMIKCSSEEEDDDCSRAHYLNSNCLLLTYFNGEVANMVDQHFTRALNEKSHSEDASGEKESDFIFFGVNIYCWGLRLQLQDFSVVLPCVVWL